MFLLLYSSEKSSQSRCFEQNIPLFALFLENADEFEIQMTIFCSVK